MGCACEPDDHSRRQVLGAVVFAVGGSAVACVIGLDATVQGTAVAVEVVAVVAGQSKSQAVSAVLHAYLCA